MGVLKRLRAAVLLVCALICVSGGAWAAESDMPVRYNEDRTVAAITIDAATSQMVRELIEQVQRGGGVRDAAAFVSLVGAAPELIVTGNNAYGVEKAVRLYQAILANANKQRNLIVISASLRQLSKSDARNIGLNLMPNAVSYQIGRRYGRGSYAATSRTNNNEPIASDQTYLRTENSGTLIAQSGNLMQFDDAMGRSKILVSSEVFTPNGMKGQISSIQRVPVFTMDKNGNVNTQYQDLETSIVVTPTIVSYNEERPEESNVRMDVAVKVAIVSGARKMQSISAPEYAVKTLNTTQIIRADGSSSIVGTFVSDTDIKTRSGVPFLSEIPLLKYLFSQSTTQTVRDMAVLTLAVRVLPPEEDRQTVIQPDRQQAKRVEPAPQYRESWIDDEPENRAANTGSQNDRYDQGVPNDINRPDDQSGQSDRAQNKDERAGESE